MTSDRPPRALIFIVAYYAESTIMEVLRRIPALPGYETETWLGLIAPSATPRDIVARINAEVLRVMALPDVRDKLLAQGLTLSRSTPDQFAAHIRSEHAKWSKLIKEAGIKAE